MDQISRRRVVLLVACISFAGCRPRNVHFVTIGTGSVTGGNVLPVGLTAVDQVFFEGAGDMADIPIRVNLSGVSVLIPVDSYSATLYFTVIDIP
mgnify:CR=1 FL=1